MRSRNELLDSMTEEQLTNAVVGLFKAHRWLVTHFRPARTERGWTTPIQGDRGFPDIVAVRRVVSRVDLVVLELKSKSGRLSTEQKQWIELLAGVVGDVHVEVVRPAGYPMLEILARHGIYEYRRRRSADE